MHSSNNLSDVQNALQPPLTVFKAGGFDAVIGNPPYVFGRDWKALGIPEWQKAFLGNKYRSSPYQLDMFSLFMERALELCRETGYVSQIVPNVWLTNTYSSITRAFYLAHTSRLLLTIPPTDVFRGITVDTVIYCLRKENTHCKQITAIALDKTGHADDLFNTPADSYLSGERPIATSINPALALIAERVVSQHPSLSSVAQMTRGVHPYRTGGFGKTAFGAGHQTARDVEERPHNSAKRLAGYRPFVYGKDLARYAPAHATDFIKYGPWLAEPRAPHFFQGERLYSRKILARRLVVTLETGESVADQQVYITKANSKSITNRYLLGVLASRWTAAFIRSYFDEATATFPQIKVGQLGAIPIRLIDFSKKEDKALHDKVVSLVDRMFALRKSRDSAQSPSSKESFQRQFDTTDRQIDQLVYQLYDLTETEIRIVEESAL